MQKDDILEQLAPFGQQHLLAFWDSLTDTQRASLAAEIEAVDFALIQRLYQSGASHEDWQTLAARAVTPPAVRLRKVSPQSAGVPRSRADDSRENEGSDCSGSAAASDGPTRQEARERGRQALAAGEVGVLLVAGGQGSRLGFEHPKGMFPIGPVSDATLLQIHFEKAVAAARRYDARVPLYVMTSPVTHDETVAFLDQKDHFGLAPEDLVVFCQGAMPAVDAATGSVLLADRDRLFLSPDGHGGVVQALRNSGAINHMLGAGVESLYYFQVDNPLTPVCDPEFLGYHLLSQSEFTTLVVAKQRPEDKLGVVVDVDGVVRIIEYINLPADAAARRAEDGSLALWAGSIAVHGVEVEFLRRVTERDHGLPFHTALKKVPHLSPAGEFVDPVEPNALKFERFVFDLMPQARRAVVVEGDPADCFAPLKNGSGAAATDTPETVRAALVAQHRRWLEAAGARIAPDVAVEISPLWALDAVQVAERVEKGLTIDKDTYLR